MRWRNAVRSGGTVGKRPGGSDCVLRALGGSPMRGAHELARARGTIKEYFRQGAGLGGGVTHGGDPGVAGACLGSGGSALR